jgi:hypothetical protein
MPEVRLWKHILSMKREALREEEYGVDMPARFREWFLNWGVSAVERAVGKGSAEVVWQCLGEGKFEEDERAVESFHLGVVGGLEGTIGGFKVL